MLELFNYYYHLNRKNHQFTKLPIHVAEYCRVVKLSVLGVEFRDKILQRKACPMLLGHANQPAPGQTMQKPSSSTCFKEIKMYIELLNFERNQAMKLLYREFENILTMRKRCKELHELN